MSTTQGAYRRALALIKAGHQEEARDLLKRVIREDVRHVDAWMRYAGTFSSTEERLKVLRWCLKYNPESELARKALTRLEQQHPPQAQAPSPELTSTPPITSLPTPAEAAVEGEPSIPYPEPPSVSEVEDKPLAETEHASSTATKAQPGKKVTAKSVLVIIGAGITGLLCCCSSWIFVDLIEAQEFGYALGPLALIVGAGAFYGLFGPQAEDEGPAAGEEVSSPAVEADAAPIPEERSAKDETGQGRTRAELQAAIRADPHDDTLWLQWLATFTDPQERQRAVNLWLLVDADNVTAQKIKEKLDQV
jgi:hypothetical protein